ncbi:hypothetical protein LINGRAHAP2_LOCUS14425 [Linum grandiflorum]
MPPKNSSGNPPPPALLVDPDHPFYISSGDNPALVIVPVVLTGAADYYSWARSVHMALMSKNKLGFIDPLFHSWRRANALVLAWLNKAVSPKISQSVLWLESAREVWIDLQERFCRSNLVRINDLHDQISSFVKVLCLSPPITPDSRCCGTSSSCFARFPLVRVPLAAPALSCSLCVITSAPSRFSGSYEV